MEPLSEGRRNSNKGFLSCLDSESALATSILFEQLTASSSLHHSCRCETLMHVVEIVSECDPTRMMVGHQGDFCTSHRASLQHSTFQFGGQPDR